MRETGLARYVWSCGVLTVPILVWNIVCTRFLPPALASNEFSRDIPPLVTYGENILRVVVMVLPFLMPQRWQQKASAEASCCLRWGRCSTFSRGFR